MALNAKVAMLICLGFIGGMAWLVNQAARPIVEMPSPLIVRAELGPAVEPVVATEILPANRPAEAVEVVGRFERPSALEQRAADAAGTAERLALSQTPVALAAAKRVLLPPLHRPPEPALATASPGPIGEVRLASAAEVPTEPVETVGPAVANDRSGLEEPPEPASVSASSAAEPKRYRVRRHDSLTKIVRREWRSDDPKLVWALLEANPQLKGRPNRIRVGEELRIPDLAWARETVAAAGKRPTVTLVSDPVARAGSEKPAKARYYTIRKRDCLASIARRYLNDHRRWREIAELNGLRNANRIVPGMQIKLPPAVEDDGRAAT